MYQFLTLKMRIRKKKGKGKLANKTAKSNFSFTNISFYKWHLSEQESTPYMCASTVYSQFCREKLAIYLSFFFYDCSNIYIFFPMAKPILCKLRHRQQVKTRRKNKLNPFEKLKNKWAFEHIWKVLNNSRGKKMPSKNKNKYHKINEQKQKNKSINLKLYKTRIKTEFTRNFIYPLILYLSNVKTMG